MKMRDHLKAVHGIPLWLTTALEPLLASLSVIYRCATFFRNRAYDKKEAWRIDKLFVISLGNLSSGGTGKTPIGLAMCRWLQSQHIPMAVVLRGYGQKQGLSDEAELYRQTVDRVYETPDRREGLQQAQNEGAQVVILDDAFQHRRVHRDINVVIIDATRPPWQDHILPWGFLREGCGALKRADWLLLSRIEQLDQTQSHQLKQHLSQHFAPERTFEVRTQAVGIVNGLGAEVNKAQWQDEKVMLLSAIGHPENFKISVETLGMNVVAQHWFADHHHFSEAEMHSAFQQAHDLGAQLLMTSKDVVKWTLDKASVWVLNIEADWPHGALKKILQEQAPHLVPSHSNLP